MRKCELWTVADCNDTCLESWRNTFATLDVLICRSPHNPMELKRLYALVDGDAVAVPHIIKRSSEVAEVAVLLVRIQEHENHDDQENGDDGDRCDSPCDSGEGVAAAVG